jgi:hypothetical protein
MKLLNCKVKKLTQLCLLAPTHLFKSPLSAQASVVLARPSPYAVKAMLSRFMKDMILPVKWVHP